MRRLELLLLVLGLVLLGWCAWTVLESRRFQAEHERQFRSVRTRPPSPPAPPLPGLSPPAPRRVPEGTAVGRIEIPRLGISAVIAEGQRESTLRLAVGHIPGTALPGEGGNVGLAAHRDSFFRSLARIRLQDEIRLAGEGGGSTLYRVDSIAVVEPSDVSVLRAGSQPSVTLVTCYPFHYVGAAPKRFVVRAGRVNPPGSGNALASRPAPGPSAGSPQAAARRPRGDRPPPAP